MSSRGGLRPTPREHPPHSRARRGWAGGSRYNGGPRRRRLDAGPGSPCRRRRHAPTLEPVVRRLAKRLPNPAWDCGPS